MRPTRPTALITGACSGIGLEFARELARRGYRLVLVSERAEQLAQVATELDADAITLDLARPEAARELKERVDGLGVQIDTLVLNAGMFFFGEVLEIDAERSNRMLQLHVVTPSLLCREFGPAMKLQRHGHILMVSSTSAWRAFPGIAHYSASKRYLRDFACALRSELLPYGVNVTCLAPGATATPLFDPKVVPVALARRLGVMSDPAWVARTGIDALLRGEAEVIPGRSHRAFATLAARTPQPLVDWLRRRAPWLR